MKSLENCVEADSGGIDGDTSGVREGPTVSASQEVHVLGAHGQPPQELPVERGRAGERLLVRGRGVVSAPCEAVGRVASLDRAGDEGSEVVEKKPGKALRLHDAEILAFEGGLSEVG